jgi:hypothetical protein
VAQITTKMGLKVTTAALPLRLNQLMAGFARHLGFQYRPRTDKLFLHP